MPKRTNEFQELTARIQRLMAPEGAIVTESASVGEDGREIDILIETNEGPYRIKAVEAKDEGRKMSIENFESILGKYLVTGGVSGVNKIVVITHKGFSKKVIERAKKLDIDLFTLEEAMEFDWAKYLPFYNKYQCIIKLRNVNILLEEGQLIRDLERGRVDYSDKCFGCLKGFVIYVWKNIATQQYRDMIMQLNREVVLTGKNKDVNLRVSFDSDPKPILTYKNNSYTIKEVLFDICIQIKYNEMPNDLPFYFDFSILPEIRSFELLPPINGIDLKIIEKNGRVIHSESGKDIGSIMEWIKGKIFSGYSWAQQQINPESFLCAQNYSDGCYYSEIFMRIDKDLCIRINSKNFDVDEIKVVVYTRFGNTISNRKQYELKDNIGEVKTISDMQAIAAGVQFNITSDESGKLHIQTRPFKQKKEAKKCPLKSANPPPMKLKI